MDIETKNLQTEMHIIRLEESAGLPALSRMVVRLMIRSARILCGCILLGISLWAGFKAWDILSTPFAAQSLTGILGGVSLGAIFLWLLSASASCAFGRGPEEEDESERVRRLAIARLGNRIHMTNAQGHLDENH